MAGVVISGARILMAACTHLSGVIVFGHTADTWAAAIMAADSLVVATTVAVTLLVMVA